MLLYAAATDKGAPCYTLQCALKCLVKKQHILLHVEAKISIDLWRMLGWSSHRQHANTHIQLQGGTTSDSATLGAICLGQLLVLLQVGKLQDLLLHKSLHFLQQRLRDDRFGAKFS